jgi:3-phytase
LRLRRAFTIALLVPTLHLGNGRAAGSADLSAAAPAAAEAQPLPQEQTATLVGRWPAPEARQGVAVDATAFYAIDNRAIGKYDKTSGQKIAEWKAGTGEPFIHMNGGVIIGDELLCPHSNYPATPMVSSIEVFDATTLRHKRSQALGEGRGSITWVDFHDGSWWVAFAHYTLNGGEPGKGSEMTTLRRFDAAWREQESWSFPPEVVGKWAGMSSSGGVWGADDRLYTTGHDEPEIYVLDVPPGGGTLKLVSVIRMESAGQGIAFDRATGRLYSIQRATREVIASTLPPLPGGRATPPPVAPALVSDPVPHDSEDVAFWIDPRDPSNSLILGTDKHETEGALFVYDISGHIIPEKTVTGVLRPNNVDVEYGFVFDGKPIDIAVMTERGANRLRVFRLPEMTPIDAGGIEVFAGVKQRRPMGIALYKRPRDGAIFAIVSRSVGPSGSYIWQYRLEETLGAVTAVKVREFGIYSGTKTMESLAVDDRLGYVYASDEQVGVRKYHADPDVPNANRELALFATTGFAEDHEGISIYETGSRTGYLIVSDQGARRFHLFPREGDAGNPHQHSDLGTVTTDAFDSDGSDVTNVALGSRFPHGALVAMSGDRTYRFYEWATFLARLRP